MDWVNSTIDRLGNELSPPFSPPGPRTDMPGRGPG